jgi:hypothetical protein
VAAESFGQRHKQGSVAVAASAVGEDEGVVVWDLRRVQEAADGGIERIVAE